MLTNTWFLYRSIGLQSVESLKPLYISPPDVQFAHAIIYPKLTLGQRHRWAPVHLYEFESADSAKRTMSGHGENVEAFSYGCR